MKTTRLRPWRPPDGVLLGGGSHDAPSEGFCALELLNYVVAGWHTDAWMPCLTPFTRVLPLLNDLSWASDDERTLTMMPFLTHLATARPSARDDRMRARRLVRHALEHHRGEPIPRLTRRLLDRTIAEFEGGPGHLYDACALVQAIIDIPGPVSLQWAESLCIDLVDYYLSTGASTAEIARRMLSSITGVCCVAGAVRETEVTA